MVANGWEADILDETLRIMDYTFIKCLYMFTSFVFAAFAADCFHTSTGEETQGFHYELRSLDF